MPRYCWNGIGLTAPDDWEPASIEKDGLLLERDGTPVCELKWRVVQGSFSFEKHFRKLTKGHKGVDMRPLDGNDGPQSWRDALHLLESSGLRHESFFWQSPPHAGLGVLLHNPGTGLAALVQFFITDTHAETIAAQTLATLRDHSGGKTIPWAMFGLSGRVPAAFVLNTFTFKPGHYQVRYWKSRKALRNAPPPGKGPGVDLTFERFAPASVILKDTPLEEWITTGLHAPPKHLEPAPKDDRLRWDGIGKTSPLRKLLRRQMYQQGAAWTTGNNAILAVTASGTDRMDDQQFHDICETYELV